MLVGIGDDAAVVEPVRNQVEVLTVDSVVEGVHFDRRFTPPAAIGHRALAVNLSDLAAMGATPRLALLSLALPSDLPCHDFDAIADGFTALAAAHQIHVAGGNLTRSPGPLVLDVTAVGWTKRRRVLTRGGAKPGDGVYVTGSVGGARGRPAGASCIRSARPDLESCVARYLYPAGARESRRAARAQSRRDRVHGSQRWPRGRNPSNRRSQRRRRDDRSRGDPGRSGGAHMVRIPRTSIRSLEALSGGDDYELVFTASPKMRRPPSCRRAARRRRHHTHRQLHEGLDGRTDAERRRPERPAPTPKGFGHFR